MLEQREQARRAEPPDAAATEDPETERPVAAQLFDSAVAAVRRALATRDHQVVAWLTVAFIVSGLAFAVATPVFQNPDEATHVDMVRHYANDPLHFAGPALRQTEAVRGAFAATGLRDEPTPSAIESIPESRPDYGPFDQYGGDEPATVCPVTCQNYQYIHPPGWYLLAAPVAMTLDSQPFTTVVVGLRMFNVFLGALLVWATWYTARQVWPSRRRPALVAAGLTACCGPLAATLGSVNNDALMLALMGVGTALLAHVLRQGASPRATVALGVVVGLGLFTKGQFLPFAVIALVGVAIAPPVTNRLPALLRYLVPAGIGALWWLRVLADTHSFTPRGSELVPPPSDGPWRSVGFPRFFADRFPELLDQLPGRYGWQLVTLPGGVLTALQLAAVALTIGWLAARPWRRPGVAELRMGLLATLPLALLLASGLAAYDTFHASGADHGFAPRYVYGAVPVIAVGAVAAMTAIADRIRVARDARPGEAGAAPIPTHTQVVAYGQTWVLVAAALVGTFVSIVVALRGAYFTHDAGRLFQRAGIVAPVTHVKAWLVVLTVGWLAALGRALQLAWPTADDRGRADTRSSHG